MKQLSELSSIFWKSLKENECKISDSDLLCFENAVSNFLSSGKKEDAFTVYFCYSEIFNLFGTGYVHGPGGED